MACVLTGALLSKAEALEETAMMFVEGIDTTATSLSFALCAPALSAVLALL